MATYTVSGYMTLSYHFCDVEIEADSPEDITEWDIIQASMEAWDGEMMDYSFVGEPTVYEADDY